MAYRGSSGQQEDQRYAHISISDLPPNTHRQSLLIVSRKIILLTFLTHMHIQANLNSQTPDASLTPDSVRSSKSPSGPPDLALFSQSFPFTPMGRTNDVQGLIETHLPSWDRALSLSETYFEQVSWVFRGVTRIQLIDDMLPVVYRKQVAPPGEDYSGPHDLALLFIIFAVGALVEPEPSNAEGEHFHQISRAALSLQPVLEKPSIVTIQTLHLMSIYNAMSGSDLKSETSMEMTWSLITLAAHLSQTVRPLSGLGFFLSDF